MRSYILSVYLSWYLLWAGINIALGALAAVGMYFLGQARGKPKLARLGMILTPISGIVFLSIPTAIAFFILLCVTHRDIGGSTYYADASSYADYSGGVLGLSGLDGDMKDRVYAIGSAGIMIGRDASCAIRYGDGTPGVSRQHCALYWQGSDLMIVDLNSAYGTYLADGSRLPPQYPTRLSAGSRFYVADRAQLFQVIIMK